MQEFRKRRKSVYEINHKKQEITKNRKSEKVGNRKRRKSDTVKIGKKSGKSEKVENWKKQEIKKDVGKSGVQKIR